jgi:hypothetical protein
MKIVWCVLMFGGLGRRICIWRDNRKLAKLVSAYVKLTSKQKESYSKQLNKLQELLMTESVDELTYERMKRALEDDYIVKREEAKLQLSSTMTARNCIEKSAHDACA